MKNIVRAFIVVLAVTGAAASTQISSASSSNATTTVSATIAKTGALPIPTCAPDDPNACGMAGK